MGLLFLLLAAAAQAAPTAAVPLCLLTLPLLCRVQKTSKNDARAFAGLVQLGWVERPGLGA